jgi:hypothetical protein
MNSAYDDVVSAAEDYADTQISVIESALETLEDTIDEIPDSATLVEADLARQNAYETLVWGVEINSGHTMPCLSRGASRPDRSLFVLRGSFREAWGALGRSRDAGLGLTYCGVGSGK